MVTQAFSCELHKASSLSHAAQHRTPKLGSFDPNSFLSPFFEGPVRSFWGAQAFSERRKTSFCSPRTCSRVAFRCCNFRRRRRVQTALFYCLDRLAPPHERSPLKTPPKKKHNFELKFIAHLQLLVQRLTFVRSRLLKKGAGSKFHLLLRRSERGMCNCS